MSHTVAWCPQKSLSSNGTNQQLGCLWKGSQNLWKKHSKKGFPKIFFILMGLTRMIWKQILWIFVTYLPIGAKAQQICIIIVWQMKGGWGGRGFGVGSLCILYRPWCKQMNVLLVHQSTYLVLKVLASVSIWLPRGFPTFE